MKLRRWQILTALLAIGIYALWRTEKWQNSVTELQPSSLELVVQEVGDTGGWMYSVFDGGVLLIRQQFLPVVKGQCRIPTEEAAEQLGILVMEKIRSKKMPAITKEELEEIITMDLKKDCIH